MKKKVPRKFVPMKSCPRKNRPTETGLMKSHLKKSFYSMKSSMAEKIISTKTQLEQIWFDESC